MREFEIRWTNFRGIKSSGWLRIKPLTLVIGPNAAGKTSLIAPLLILKQTLESLHAALPLKTQGELFNAGSLRNLVFSHSAESQLGLDIRFVPREGDVGSEENLGKVGDDPPGEVQLRFRSDDPTGAPVLARYQVRDVHGRIMLTRTRTNNGSYTLSGPVAPEQTSKLARAAGRAQPEHFLFTPEGMFREYFQPIEKRGGKTEKSGRKRKPLRLEIKPPVQVYMSLLSYITQYFEMLASGIAYIGPLRERPCRLYELSGERPSSVGTRGESAPEVIFRQRETRLLRDVNSWIEKFDFGMEMTCTELTEGAFNLSLRRAASSPEINLADTGFGVSQVLPLIVQACYAEKDSLIIAEQPEIHLNPRLQAMLADLFAAVVAQEVGVIVETHSEHLLLRLRRLVAEGKIKASQVAIYFVERQKDVSRIREVRIQKNGHIDAEDWPTGFFDEGLREALALSAAQGEA